MLKIAAVIIVCTMLGAFAVQSVHVMHSVAQVVTKALTVK